MSLLRDSRLIRRGGGGAQAHTHPPCARQEAVQRQNESASGQAAAAARPCKPPRHEPSLGLERILMRDYACTQAQDKGVPPTTSHEEGHTKATKNRPPKALPLPTADGMDKV
jgi:hypothetical protein